jgi:hypothetical protein
MGTKNAMHCHEESQIHCTRVILTLSAQEPRRKLPIIPLGVERYPRLARK